MVWRLVSSSIVVALWMMATLATASAQNRPLAPGVLTIIPPEAQHEETLSGPLQLVEIVKGMPELAWEPNFEATSRTVYERAQAVVLRRQVWCLEFAFKPLRMIQVDVPQPTGKMQKKLIWYLVYRIRYLGGDVVPEPVEDEWGHTTYDSKLVTQEGRYFFPQFLLESHDLTKSYQDRIIPAAHKLVEEREMRGQTLLNSVEVGRQPIPLSTEDNPQEVWGLATWEDIDPRLDFFSVFVKGLTNAYQPVDVPDGFKPGDPPGTGRDLLAKTLQLNFWRPGDAINEPEDTIYFGVPYAPEAERQSAILSAFGLTERVDYLWVYR
ncbi:MAG: hypothetical protein ACYC6N_13895 [Pirellulaceae bacterium]